MNDNGKILHCIPKDWACFILTVTAIISAIGDILIVLKYLAIWFMLFAMSAGGSIRFGGFYYRDWIPEVFNYVIVPLVCFIDFIFIVVLCIGLRKRQPKLVKVFYVYGVVINALTLLVSFILLSCDSEQLGLQRYSNYSSDYGLEGRVVLGITILVACVIHELLLVLVYKTYQMLLEDSEASDRLHLVEYSNKQSTIIGVI